MSRRLIAANTLFMALHWFTVLLASVIVHEVGHAVGVWLAAGWTNNIAGFGSTSFVDQSLLIDALEYSVGSGLAPADWDRQAALDLVAYLAARHPAFQVGVLGGWLAQLVAAAATLALARWRTFQAEASAQARLFWGSFAIFNLAWLGGLLFLVSFLPYDGTDGIVLKQVILQDSAPAHAALLVTSVALAAAGVIAARKIGPATYAGLGLDEAGGRHLALAWCWLTILAGFLAKIVVLAPIVLVAVVAVPAFVFSRMAAGNQAARARPYMWFATLAGLALLLGLAASRTGITVNHDSGALTAAILKAHYCDAGDCLPAGLAEWVGP